MQHTVRVSTILAALVGVVLGHANAKSFRSPTITNPDQMQTYTYLPWPQMYPTPMSNLVIDVRPYQASHLISDVIIVRIQTQSRESGLPSST